MASRRTTQTQHKRIVKEIERKFGKVIDLERTPLVLVEIIREFGHRFDEEDGGGGSGGVSPGTVAVGITPPTGEFQNPLIVKAILTVQRDVKALSKKLDRLISSK